MAAIPEEGQARRIQGGGEGPQEQMTLTLESALEGAEPKRLRARVTRFALWGLRPEPPSEAPLHRGGLALVQGELEQALAQLPAEAGVSRAWALARMGRVSEAVEALAGLDWSDPRALRRLPLLVRARRDPFLPLLRQALGERWFGIYADQLLPGLRPE